MVFWNKRSFVQSRDDALSDATFQEIKSQLDREQRYEVQRLLPRPEDLPRLAQQAYSGATGFFGPSLALLSRELAEYCQRCNCDALLLVASSKGTMDPNSNQSFKGFAWVGHSGFGDDVGNSAVAAYLQLFLIDGTTGTVAAAEPNATDEGTIVHRSGMSAAHWPADMASINSEQWLALTRTLTT
jgi:hypothetical protein